jgi:plastocyanin
MRGSRLMTLVVLLLAVGLVAGACAKTSSSSSGTTTPPTETTSPPAPSPSESESEGGTIMIGSDTANDHGSKDVSGMDETEVELDDFYFEPTVIKGTAGAQIKLELDNEGQALHNFSLPEQNIDQDVTAGQKVDVTVTFPQSGFLEFFCKYHKASGMVGELTV